MYKLQVEKAQFEQTDFRDYNPDGFAKLQASLASLDGWVRTCQ